MCWGALAYGCLLLSVALFSLLFNLVFNRAAFPGDVFNRSGAFFLVFRITMKFALPVWCLCLPFVIALKDAEEGRMRTILVSGILIGPAALGLWCFMLQLRGGDTTKIWLGDPLIGIGGFSGMIFALIVGFLTTSFYVMALKVLYRPVGPKLTSCC
jgi:cellobiose-specific phosphotransferase system component IIC